jgi:3-oxoadipate enol-lactonase
MRFVRVNGIAVQYSREGLQAGMPLVFINSLGTDLRIWDNLVQHFAGRFSILRYDKRGHGLSDCPPGPYTIRDHTNDLEGLLAHLKIEDAILVGISVGGMIALDYAARHPEGIKALVLCDTAAQIGTADMWNERIAALRESGMDVLLEGILTRWFAPGFASQRPADYRGYANMLTRTPLMGYTATCEAIRDADLTEAAGTIQTRSLVLCGAEDTATPPDLARGLADTLVDARFELIESAAHLPCIEQPDVMAAKMNQFFMENNYV